MEILTKAFRIYSINHIEEFRIRLNDNLPNNSGSYDIVMARERLTMEKKKIISIFRELKEKGVIKSIYIPKNRKIQDKLDNLIRIKKEINKSLERIKMLKP